MIRAGDYIASVPAWAKADLQCYHPPWIKPEDVFREIKERTLNYTSTDEWLRENPPKIEFGAIFVWPPYETDIDHPGCQTLAEAWKRATGRQAQFSGFKAVDDLAFVQALGIPGVSFGPGDLSMGAHGPDEYVPVQQVIDCTRALACMIVDWCGIE